MRISLNPAQNAFHYISENKVRAAILIAAAIITTVGIVLAAHYGIGSFFASDLGKIAAGSFGLVSIVLLYLCIKKNQGESKEMLLLKKSLGEMKNLTQEEIELLNEKSFIYKFLMDPNYKWNAVTRNAIEYDLGFENGAGIVMWLNKNYPGDSSFVDSFKKTYPTFPLDFAHDGTIRFANSDITALLCDYYPQHQEALRYLFAFLFIIHKDGILSGLQRPADDATLFL